MIKPLTAVQQDILDAVRRFPEGGSVAQLEAALSLPHSSRRTLQRVLAVLIEQGRIVRSGRGRASRYYEGSHRVPLEGEASIQAGATFSADTHVDIFLSPVAREVEAYVRQPVQRRRPVGYHREFLDTYRPNETFYLTQGVRDQLREQGTAVTVDEPAGTYARRIAHRLLIDLSWNSSRLEGNTYSLLETERLLSLGEVAAGKTALESQMILNHKGAIEFLISAADEIGFNRYTILNLHALLSDDLLIDPTASGRLRMIPVGIGESVFMPIEGPRRIAECFDQVLRTATAIRDPFEQAFFAIVHLPYLQPFEDVNKRVSRLAANIPFFRDNLCPLSFVDIPKSLYLSAMLGIYELNQTDLLADLFVWAYKRSCARYSVVRQTLGEPDPFRVRYRRLIAEAVAAVVRGGLNQSEAVAWIRQRAREQLPEADRARFLEIVETQLMALHAGSIARYHVRPGEFEVWRARWVGVP
ncbi:Fic family protein [Alcaligenaceae bacterium CGII-47]|nr:Fic family protein [Alcaligenaceae bacterium CGII-47]